MCPTPSTQYLLVTELNDCIRAIDLDAHTVVTLCGSTTGRNGLKDGPGEKSLFNFPYGITSMSDDTVMVSEADNRALRSIQISLVQP